MESHLLNADATSLSPQTHLLISMESQPAYAKSFQPQSNLISFENKDNTNTNGSGSLASTDSDQPLEIESLEKILNYKFKNKRLLMQAFTDASYDDEKCNSYKLLELLGDSVLNLLIINELINLYPTESPGPLTKLRSVNIDTDKLARVAVKHKLYRYLRHKKPLLQEQILEYVEAIEKHPLHSHGLLKVPKSLANIVESTIGAIFKDCNSIETVWKVIKPLLEPIIPLDKLKNHPMTELNEMCQKRNLKLTSEDTWEENKTFSFIIEDKLVGRGHHPLKKETARNCAAKNAVDNFSTFFGDL